MRVGVLIALILVPILMLTSIIGLKITGDVVNTGNHDDFAKCLTASGAKMYGAYWCPHCTNQKKMFGESWQYVNYIECALSGGGQTDECNQAGIRGYPTWEFQGGTRANGELSLEKLSQFTGCPLL